MRNITIAQIKQENMLCISDTVDSPYLEIEGTSKTLRDIRTSTYQTCSIEEKEI